MPERVARELRKFAVEVHLLASQVPAGHSELALLQLSERMKAEAERWLRGTAGESPPPRREGHAGRTSPVIPMQ